MKRGNDNRIENMKMKAKVQTMEMRAKIQSLEHTVALQEKDLQISNLEIVGPPSDYKTHLCYPRKRKPDEKFSGVSKKKRLGLPQLQELLLELSPIADKWYLLGTQLQVEKHALNAIRYGHGDVKTCLKEMLCTWLKMDFPVPSWSTVINTLECIGEGNLAKKLKVKYIYHYFL